MMTKNDWDAAMASASDAQDKMMQAPHQDARSAAWDAAWVEMPDMHYGRIATTKTED